MKQGFVIGLGVAMLLSTQGHTVLAQEPVATAEAPVTEGYPAEYGDNPEPNAPTAGAQQKPVTQQEVAEQNRLSDPGSIPSASDSMDEWFRQVRREFGLSTFGEKNGKIFVIATENVALKPADPQFGDALAAAIDQLMMKLRKNYLLDRFGTVVQKEYFKTYSDRSTNAEQIPLPEPDNPGFMGKVMLMLDRSLDVTIAKLDKMLVDLGVPSEQLAKMTPKMKKELYKKVYINNIMKEASGSVAGLIPIQTNMVIDGNNGHTMVGAVAVVSSKTEQVARDISLHRPTLIAGKGKKIHDLLPDTPDHYMGTFGVRLVYEEDGTPALLSYGLSSYRPDTGNDYINAELREEAKQAAVSQADAQIAMMVNGVMSTKSEQKRGSEVRRFAEREQVPNSATVINLVNNIIKVTTEEAQSSAQMRMRGLSTVDTWSYTVKSGQKFVGAVRVWKYSTLGALNRFDRKSEPSKTDSQKPTYQQFQRSSKTHNTLDDF